MLVPVTFELSKTCIQDEAMRTRFICAVKNEAVLKAVFKLRDDELTFSKAVEVVQEI